MNDERRVRGLWCATLTPLTSAGELDHARMTTHAHALLAAGVDGVAPFGTTGEGPSFSVDERRSGLDALLRAGVMPSQIVVGTGCASATDTLALTRHALQSGVMRCLILPPFFYKNVADDAVYAFYAGLIDRVADPRLRVYVYHIPQFSGVGVWPDVVRRLADAYPGVVAGVKDSAADWSNTARLIERVPHLDLLVGHEPDLPKLMRSGGAGTICGIANVYPDLVRALLAPDVPPGAEARMTQFLDVLSRFPFLPAFKAIKAAQTGDAGWNVLRTPWLPLPDAARNALIEALRAAGFAAG
jgi:4-hydroxy-tetrahydrodipicolinate synthase